MGCARRGGEHDAVGRVSAGIVGNAETVVREDDSDLLISAGLQLLRIPERSEETLIVGLAKKVNLFGSLGEVGSQVYPSVVIRSR